MQADLLGTLIGLMANVAGEQKNELLDVVHEAGLRATDQEERSGHALDQESARAMRQELVRIMAIAKAAAGVES